MRKLLGTAAACVAFAACSVAGVERSSPAKIAGPSPRAYAYVVVSVGDMQQALDLWEERFGMELSRREQGADVGLARIWGLADDAIADQALLNTPGMIDGGIHLVRFTRPGDAVRDGAAPVDLAALSLEIAVQDLAEEDSELRKHVHDGVELVFRERQGRPAPLSSKGYGVALQMATVVPDIERELAFFQHVLGLEALSTGMPPGGQPDVRIVGARDSRFGRLALVHYAGTPGRDLYPRAVPPARGILSVTYVVPDLAPILARGRGAGIADHGPVRSILGEGRMASVTSPAGLRIDLVQL